MKALEKFLGMGGDDKDEKLHKMINTFLNKAEGMKSLGEPSRNKAAAKISKMSESLKSAKSASLSKFLAKHGGKLGVAGLGLGAVGYGASKLLDDEDND